MGFFIFIYFFVIGAKTFSNELVWVAIICACVADRL